MEILIKQKSKFITINLVIQETATVISNKVNHQVSLEFLNKFPSLQVELIRVESALEQAAWRIFKAQTKKGTSFIDCANLAILEYYKLDKILSFDDFYPKKLRLA